MKYVATVDGQAYAVGLQPEGTVTLDGEPVEVDLESIDGGFHYSLLLGRRSHEVFVERCGDVCLVTVGGQRYRVQVKDAHVHHGDERRRAPVGPGEAEVVSPMPGVVVAVLVEPGQEVRTGEGLLILEAMKMENEIRARRTGRVGAVHVVPGQRVSQNDLLVVIR